MANVVTLRKQVADAEDKAASRWRAIQKADKSENSQRY